MAKWLNKRFLEAKLNNMIIAFIIPQSQSARVIQWTLPCGNAEQYDYWVHYKAQQSVKRRFNVRFLAAKPLQSSADIIP